MEPARITKAQIKAIWTLARAVGLDRDTLYEMIPSGSMRALTRRQAAQIIDRLGPGRWKSRQPSRNCGTRRGPASPNVVRLLTPKQRAYIRHLFDTELGWKDQPGRVAGFLQKVLGISRLEDVAKCAQGTKLITAILAYLKWVSERGPEATRA